METRHINCQPRNQHFTGSSTAAMLVTAMEKAATTQADCALLDRFVAKLAAPELHPSTVANSALTLRGGPIGGLIDGLTRSPGFFASLTEGASLRKFEYPVTPQMFSLSRGATIRMPEAF